MIITPDAVVQVLVGISINNVEAFRSNVNAITDKDNDMITMIDRRDRPFWPGSADPITIGRNGSIHGATTVSTPAKIEIRKNSILFNCLKNS
jgi:hypothetical protein